MIESCSLNTGTFSNPQDESSLQIYSSDCQRLHLNRKGKIKNREALLRTFFLTTEKISLFAPSLISQLLKLKKKRLLAFQQGGNLLTSYLPPVC